MARRPAHLLGEATLTPLGTVRVVWEADGRVLKDETVPFTLGAVETVGDGVKISVLGMPDSNLQVNFHFNPPLRTP